MSNQIKPGKIALFGATGPSGKYLIKEALHQGYSVAVYTRDAAKLKDFEGKIEPVVGDLKSFEAIAECIRGSRAVISALGPNSIKVEGHRPVRRGVENIISAMKKSGVNRLIQVSTASYRDPKDGLDFQAHLLVTIFRVIAHKAYDDIKATGELIRDSGLDWTLVRVPNLKEGPANGMIETGWYGRTKLSTRLFRGDLAKFLVDQISNKDFLRAAPAIANR